MRPFLVAAVYPLHKDLWEIESRRRDLEGWPPTPRLARALLVSPPRAGPLCLDAEGAGVIGRAAPWLTLRAAWDR